MGSVEGAARKKQRLGAIQTALLMSVAVSGVVLVAAIAPGLPMALDKIPSVKRARLKNQYKNALSRLAAGRYVTFEVRNGKKYARLTPAGEKVLVFERAKLNLKNTKRRRWNGRWRVVVFDIPERQRRVRDRLRSVMQEVGFMRLQDSVWVYPYDCEDFVALLKTELHLGSAVLYMVVDEIEHDTYLKEHFGLT